MNFSLEDIVNAVGGEAFITDADKANMDFHVTGAEFDSRKVPEGGVFLAMDGEQTDGHKYIVKAFEKGAKLVITEKTPKEVEDKYGAPASKWGSYILVEDSALAWKKMGKAYREKLTIPVIGITGSVGKTSTKEYIEFVLSQKYNSYKTPANKNNELGVPLSLMQIREEHEIAVIEMGISDFGEMTRLSEMAQPDTAVITNIGLCHLENLGTRDGILKAKTEIFTHMNPEGEVCLFGGDDKLVTVSEVNGKAPFFFGEGDGELAVRIISEQELGLKGTQVKMLLNMPEKGIDNVTIDVRVPLPGHHMVINAAAAATIGMRYDLTVEQIITGIEKMHAIEGRNNIIILKDNILIDDCYNANPVSMRSSIDLLKLAHGTKMVILGDMFELGEDKAQMHAGVGEYAVEAGIDYVYCVGALSKNMYEGAQRAFEKGGKSVNISYWDTKERLIAGITEDIESGRRELIPVGTNILIKASHGMHFEEVVNLFKKLNA